MKHRAFYIYLLILIGLLGMATWSTLRFASTSQELGSTQDELANVNRKLDTAIDQNEESLAYLLALQEQIRSLGAEPIVPPPAVTRPTPTRRSSPTPRASPQPSPAPTVSPTQPGISPSPSPSPKPSPTCIDALACLP